MEETEFDPLKVEAALRPFIMWLITVQGRGASTAANYGSAVRQAVARLQTNITTARLDAYAVELPSSQRRSAFRAAWRAFVAWNASEGRTAPPVTPGRIGAPLVLVNATPLDFAIHYLLRAILPARLGNPDLSGRGLRWRDVELLPADAIIRDVEGRRLYRCARLPLDVILRWGRPDGVAGGAIIPESPGSGLWMQPADISTRARMAQTVGDDGSFPNDLCAAIWRLPAPLVESLASTPRNE